MKKLAMSMLALGSFLGLAMADPAAKHMEFPKPIRFLSFDSMYAVDGPFIGEANAIRGVIGDELPWVVRSAVGTLTRDGHLRIRVRGLVFADDASVPPDLRGINDEATFRALVSCVSESLGGEAITANVTTRGFHATINGHSEIDARIELPNPCLAPIVFILSGSEDKWFAVNGLELEEK